MTHLIKQVRQVNIVFLLEAIIGAPQLVAKMELKLILRMK
jgi:hypothetical protein